MPRQRRRQQTWRYDTHLAVAVDVFVFFVVYGGGVGVVIVVVVVVIVAVAVVVGSVYVGGEILAAVILVIGLGLGCVDAIFGFGGVVAAARKLRSYLGASYIASIHSPGTCLIRDVSRHEPSPYPHAISSLLPP